MADENTAAPPAVTQTSSASQTVTPAATPKGDPLSVLREALQPVTDKQKRQERIAKAEAKGANEVLKSLGVKKSERARVLEEAKAGKIKLAQATEQVNEYKTRAEKAEGELTRFKTQAETYEALAKTYADEQFNALPESLQKFIAATAGDSLDARLKAIKTAKDSGLITPQEAAAATAQAKTDAKPPKPATTSNAVNPKAPPPNATPSARQQWEALKAQNPRLAAQFYAANQVAIDSDWS